MHLGKIAALERLQRLRDSGSLSAEEFASAKARTLSSPDESYNQDAIEDTGPTDVKDTPSDNITVIVQRQDSDSSAFSNIIYFVIAAVGFGLALTNPTEAELKSYILENAKKAIAENSNNDNPLQAYASVLAESYGPQLIEAAITIDRNNYYIFSKFQIRSSNLVNLFGGEKIDRCLIGVAGSYYPCPE
jgi:hypothetical protein